METTTSILVGLIPELLNERAAILTAKASFDAIANTGTQAQLYEATQAIKAAQKALSDAITISLPPCWNCGTAPVGMPQNYQVKNHERQGYQIGCPLCDGHEVFGMNLAEAREQWAAQKTLKPQRDARYRESAQNALRLAKRDPDKNAAAIADLEQKLRVTPLSEVTK